MTDSLREIFIKSGAYAYERESTTEKNTYRVELIYNCKYAQKPLNIDKKVIKLKTLLENNNYKIKDLRFMPEKAKGLSYRGKYLSDDSAYNVHLEAPELGRMWACGSVIYLTLGLN